MTRRRREPATEQQHREAARVLNRMRAGVNDAMRALGVLDGAPDRGAVKAREADALMRLERQIDHVRCVLDKRLHVDLGGRAGWDYWRDPDDPRWRDEVLRILKGGRS